MKRTLGGSFLGIGLLLGACSMAFADHAPRRATHDQALAIAPAPERAPYNVEILDGDGDTLETYASHGRYYVLGQAGDRYIVHVSNPTARRIEAVISVDGIDVIDGESGDLRKRGYVVAPYGDLRIEGFRTSTTDVATFRFSSVDSSYAQRKGKGRNVGVIAVAIFEEKGPAEIVVEQAPPPPPPPPNYRYYDRDLGGADKAAPRPTTTGSTRGGGSHGHAAPPRTAAKAPAADAPSAPASGAAPGNYRGADESVSVGGGRSPCCTEQHRSRPGLGTEFGENRYSSVSFTRFVRASTRPAAVAELRYNDAAGLMALGIPVQPSPDADELGTRETADPFPGDAHFAQPPR
jgi:hypothetical protein